MTTRSLILAGAVAAFILPTAVVAQEATPAGAMSSTTDTTGSYTIVRRTVGEMQTEDRSSDGTVATTANTNTTPADIQRTIDANPGLGEELAKQGVAVEEIGAISVQPNGQVVIYDRTT
ncbi:hypothetical protein [Aureimonas glaciei]|uniref:Uncharacterized protein n=1 Tax=Aureimonas glaciei TaxID=1776957 RepID=A0A917D6J0_9HYPH|nr:hypothetical protein [Aureimonas glaciei]GGD06877.1 hypothetical protein GCM10011335_07340 [Aureimonas glaciei]